MADRETMLKQINEISFTVNDLTLFLDTHPLDDNALKAFSDAMKQRKQLMQTYAENFEPLTVDCVCPDTNNKSETHTKYRDRSILPGLTARFRGKEVLSNVEL